MGKARRSWFPLALLGFAEVGMVTAQLVSRRSPAEDQAANLLLRPAPPAGGSRLQFLTQDPFFTQAAGLPAGPAWLAALGVAVLGTAVWYARALRPARKGRFVLGTVAALLALPLLDLVGSWQFGLGDGLRGPLLATLGLLLLAAYERSRLVLVATAAFALVAAVLSADLAGVLGSAVILLAAAFAVLLRRGRETAAQSGQAPPAGR